MKRIQNKSFIQINPLLYFISEPDKVGWIYERYVNLLMYDGIVDYVDNVNYSGLFLHIRSYEINELDDFHKIMKSSVSLEHFSVLWVDEYFISRSYRYGQNHFVHPLIVYDYHEETESYSVIFFDIMKGQVFISIPEEELNAAVCGVKEHYVVGGNVSALKKTLSVFRSYSCLKGTYHLDVFIKNLSRYLYCTNNDDTEWYDLQRKELFNNRNVIYGVQIYRALINELRSSECRINYKSLHDFIKHKNSLYERLLYIEREYNVSCLLKDLIVRFGELADDLERMRLLNIKCQTKSGNFPASLCFESDYTEKLICVLERGYETELDIIPRILNELSSLTYTQKFTADHHMIQCNAALRDFRKGYYVKQFTFDKPVYSNRIDVMSKTEKGIDSENTIIINDEYRYSVKTEFANHSRVQSINIPVMQICKIECRSSETVDYTLNIVCLPGQDTSKPTFDPKLLREYDGINHIEIHSEVNDALWFRVLENDPNIFKTGFAVDASVYKCIRIDMKAAGISKKAQVFFSDVGRDIWSAQRMVEFDIIPDGEFHTYTVDMTCNEQWHGFIGGIRLDPAHYDSHCIWKAEDNAECCIKRFVFKSNTAE